MLKCNSNEIDKLASILTNDGVICVPTDTVYGLCSRISKKAYDKLLLIKNRPTNKYFPIMCLDINQVEEIAYLDDRAKKIINKYMPGPITVILNKKDVLSNEITDSKTIAVRLAASKDIELLIKKVGSPLFMTSANKSGEKECSSIEEVEKTCPLIDGILIGDTLFKEASTIVDLTNDEIKILREGPIKKENLI